MHWFSQLFWGHSAAQATVVLSLAIVLGLALGHIQIRGIRLGVGGVLFSGIFLGHFGLRVDHAVLEFAREFGLILFVFSIGLQVGPGFMDSLRRRGLKLNVLAACVVLLGVATTVACFYIFKLPLPVAVGLFSGAVTNTPSLAAASQVFAELAPSPEIAAQAVGVAGTGYAVAYPFGIFGIIIVMLLVRALFRVQPEAELHALVRETQAEHPPLANLTVRVSNAGVVGRTLGQMDLGRSAVVISRVMDPDEDGVTRVATPATVLREGMLLHAVGDPKGLKRVQTLFGPPADVDLKHLPGPLAFRDILVTHTKVAGKSPRALGLTPERGISITRVVRAGVEFSAATCESLHLGDKLVVVGSEARLDLAERLLGNSENALRHPHIMPIFFGIVAGVIVGSIPVPIPGLPSGVKLGLAGGPLLMAILLSRVHSFAGMVWHLPISANLALREVGIALFLACVGLFAGDRFVAALMDGTGFYWMSIGACITFIPLFIVGTLGYAWLKVPYPALCGLLSGSMTDPPALAFAGQMLNSDAPAQVYATVYPLTMMLRILMGQLLVLTLYVV